MFGYSDVLRAPRNNVFFFFLYPCLRGLEWKDMIAGREEEIRIRKYSAVGGSRLHWIGVKDGKSLLVIQ